MAMDAQIKGIKIVPANYDKNDEISKFEHGVITLEVPLDGDTNYKEFMQVMRLLRKDWVTVDVGSNQAEIDFGVGDDTQEEDTD